MGWFSRHKKITKEDHDKMQNYEMSIWAWNGGDNDFGGFMTEKTMSTCDKIAKDKKIKYKDFLRSLYLKYKIGNNERLWTDGTIRAR